MSRAVSKREGVVVWNLQVPKALDDEVKDAIEKGYHMTKAELIRAAVRLYLDILKQHRQ